MSQPATPATASDEVVTLLSDLIRINTSNPTHPERPAAEWVAQKLDEVGIESTILESEPGRASTIARIPGSNPDRKPLLIHGHLDVVPADAGVVRRPIRRRGQERLRLGPRRGRYEGHGCDDPCRHLRVDEKWRPTRARHRSGFCRR